MRSCRPTRGPTLKPVLIVAATANSFGGAGRRLRPEEKPVRAGASPAGSEQQRHGGRRERGRRWATPAAARRGPDDLPHTRHDELRPVRTWSWFVQPGEKACHESRPPGCRRRRLQPRHRFSSRLAEGLRSARSRCPPRPNRRSALARIDQAPAPPAPPGGASRRLRRRRHRPATSRIEQCGRIG
jgi:hypothetical protein